MSRLRRRTRRHERRQTLLRRGASFAPGRPLRFLRVCQVSRKVRLLSEYFPMPVARRILFVVEKVVAHMRALSRVSQERPQIQPFTHSSVLFFSLSGDWVFFILFLRFGGMLGHGIGGAGGSRPGGNPTRTAHPGSSVSPRMVSLWLFPFASGPIGYCIGPMICIPPVRAGSGDRPSGSRVSVRGARFPLDVP